MSATGAVLEGRCLASQGDAIDAYYSKSAPVLSAGDPAYMSQFVKESGGWLQKTYSINSSVKTLISTVAAPVPAFDACDPAESFFDGITVGWGIATALILASCITFIKKGL